MEARPGKGIMLFSAIVITTLFCSWIIGPYIFVQLDYTTKFGMALFPTSLVCSFYYYKLHTNRYPLKRWKMVLHFCVFQVVVVLFLFYPVWLGKMIYPHYCILIITIVHWELFKLLFKPRMRKISLYIYACAVFPGFFFSESYSSAAGVFLWMLILICVPLYFVNELPIGGNEINKNPL